MNWDEIVTEVTPYVVQIESPDSSGTGFLCLYNDDRTWAGIATANHVVERPDTWQQPIRLWHPATGKYHMLSVTDRVIFPDPKTDSAVIMVRLPLEFDLPQDLIPLLPRTDSLPIGAEIGWLGFPAIAGGASCFFSGIVSAIENHDTRSYFIDGVAINGVSGGPVLYFSRRSNRVQIVGVLTEYRVNRQYGEARPGLSLAQNVAHYHGVVERIRDYDEGRRKKAEFERMIKPPDGDPQPPATPQA